jgi:hypothetical protein
LNLVMDASLTIAWYFEDERTPVTEELLDRVTANGATVPGQGGSKSRTHSDRRSRAIVRMRFTVMPRSAR